MPQNLCSINYVKKVLKNPQVQNMALQNFSATVYGFKRCFSSENVNVY